VPAISSLIACDGWEETTLTMGLLKHFTLPLFSLLHAYVATKVLVLPNGKMDYAIQTAMKDSIFDPLTVMESHSVGALASFHAAFLFGCLMGIFHEHSHFRGIIITMEFILFSLDAFDAFSVGVDATPIVVLAAVAGISLAVHLAEPGIFTKDKEVDNSKSKTK
jgi:hypothetical protein